MPLTTQSEHLFRYERMVNCQIDEEDFMISYLKPLFDRLLGIANSKLNKTPASTELLTFEGMQVVLDFLVQLDDPKKDEFMTNDTQLIMILRHLCSLSSSGRVLSVNAGLTFPEFLHCYKIVIAGMLTLQHLDPEDDAREIAASLSEETVRSVREQTKERCMLMLQTFADKNVMEKLRKYEKSLIAPVSKTVKTNVEKSTGETMEDTKTPKEKTPASICIQSSPVSPGVSSEEMKQILTNKDWQLVSILDQHKDEIDSLADYIRKGKKASAERRAATYIVFLFVTAILMTGSWYASKKYHIQIESKPDLSVCDAFKQDADQLRSRWMEESLELKHKEAGLQAEIHGLQLRNEASQSRINELENIESHLSAKISGMLKENEVKEVKECAKVVDLEVESRVTKLGQKLKISEVYLEECRSKNKRCEEHLLYVTEDVGRLKENNDQCTKLLESQLTVNALRVKESVVEKSQSSVVRDEETIIMNRKMEKKRLFRKNIKRALIGASAVLIAPAILSAFVGGGGTGAVAVRTGATAGKVVRHAKNAKSVGLFSGIFKSLFASPFVWLNNILGAK